MNITNVQIALIGVIIIGVVSLFIGQIVLATASLTGILGLLVPSPIGGQVEPVAGQ